MKIYAFFRYTGAALILASTLLFMVPTFVYELDLLQSFAFHAMLGYAGLSFLLLLLHRWWWGISAMCASLLLLVFLKPYIAQEPMPKLSDGRPFKVAHFNVLYRNRNFNPTIQRALSSRADLLSFQEVDERWADTLEARLQEAYPYYEIVTEPRASRGMAVFSKYPLTNVQIHHWSGTPNITGDLDLPDSSVHFVASHVYSPRSEQDYRDRNRQIQQITAYLEKIEGPVLAIGDYNAVPWNPYIVQMRRQARLYDSRRSLAPTYPASLRAGGIPIDYVFHSDEIACLSFHAVRAGGSDHRGVIGTYLLKDTGKDV